MQNIKAATHLLNTASLEDSLEPHVLRPVRVVREYVFDGQSRVFVEILEGPEKGRVVTGLSRGSLRDKRTGEFIT